MKKFVLNIVIFGCLLVICDVALGKGFRYLVAHAKGGDTELYNRINNKITDSILIFGSSRAMHHYNPDIIADATGLSCYNCAHDANGIILMYGTYIMLRERYNPYMILYEVTPSYDLQKGDNIQFLAYLRYFYDRNGIDSIFWDIDKTEKIKMISNLYTYNLNVPQLIMDNIHPMRSVGNGYRPMDKEMLYEPEVKEESLDDFVYDDLKLNYLKRLIVECQGKTKIVFLASPLYKAKNDKVFKPIRELADEYELPFINHYCDTTFNLHKEYFYDSRHMNRKGAEAYTKVVVEELKRILDGERH